MVTFSRHELCALAVAGSALQWLGVSSCGGVTDTSVLELHRHCRSLRTVQANDCPRLTAATSVNKEEFRVTATAHGEWPLRTEPAPFTRDDATLGKIDG
jgi:hypothetical protein